MTTPSSASPVKPILPGVPVLTAADAQTAKKILNIVSTAIQEDSLDVEALNELLADSALCEAIALEVNAHAATADSATFPKADESTGGPLAPLPGTIFDSPSAGTEQKEPRPIQTLNADEAEKLVNEIAAAPTVGTTTPERIDKIIEAFHMAIGATAHPVKAIGEYWLTTAATELARLALTEKRLGELRSFHGEATAEEDKAKVIMHLRAQLATSQARLVELQTNDEANRKSLMAQVVELQSLRSALAQAKQEASDLTKKQPINTHVRLFDLVRHQRAELHEADLITDEEYVWLCGEAPMATSPKGGSPSPRRLEDYDDLRAQLDAALRPHGGQEKLSP